MGRIIVGLEPLCSQEELKTWVKFLTISDDGLNLKDALQNCVKTYHNPQTNGKYRCTLFDSSLDSEPSAAFTRTHDVYGRTPGLSKNAFEQSLELMSSYQQPDVDFMVVFDGGYLLRAKVIWSNMHVILHSLKALLTCPP